jgi:2-amino-4-hydroxy-6-hydroxymethyldihydropteridine diphosphokinase
MICYLGLGSNLGNRAAQIDAAVIKLKDLNNMEILNISSKLETKPVGYAEQPDFVNCVLEVETDLKPDILLKEILRIEKEMGRKRTFKYGPRNIDIDILFYGEEVISSPNLVIPHKELHNRKFVLDSLMELSPDLVHPLLGKTIREIQEDLCQK